MTGAPLCSALFSLDEIRVEGYTQGELWNGWACPYFTHGQARALVALWTANGWDAAYLPDADEFAVADPDTAAPPGGGQMATCPAVEIAGKKYYPIGARAWIWDEVKPCQEQP